MIRGLIFSDVDGTFLDEAGAVPFEAGWLRGVADCWRVIFASSRTAAQLRNLQAALGWVDWGIAEDGSVLASPAGDEMILGVPRPEIISRLAGTGLWMRVAGMVPSGEAPRTASILLPRRVADDPDFADFRAGMLSVDLRCSAGGRWATLTGTPDKGSAARALRERLGLRASAAIGNDANDEALLRAVPHAFVIRNATGHHPRLALIEGATLLQSPGPQGWKEMIGALHRR